MRIGAGAARAVAIMVPAFMAIAAAPGVRAQGAPAASAPPQAGSEPAAPSARVQADDEVMRRAALNAALAAAESQFGADSLAVASAADLLAKDYLSRSEAGRALPLYRRALSICERHLGTDQPWVVGLHNGLVRAYLQVGDIANALSHAQTALGTATKIYADGDPRLGESLAAAAAVHRELGDYDEALALGWRELALYKASYGPQSVQVASALSQIGQSYNASGRYAQALDLWRRALSIREAALGPDHGDVALSLTNLAMLYAELGQRAKSLPLLERSLRIDETSFGAIHGRVAVALTDLAQSLCGLRRCAEALAPALRSVRIYEQLGNPDNHRLATSLGVLASVYHALGRDVEARQLLERELDIRAKVQGPNHPDVAGVLRCLAALDWKQGHIEDARARLLRALAIAASGAQPDTLWRVQSMMRMIAARQGEREQAIYWGKAAVNTIQSMRASMQDVESEVRQSFLDDRRRAYNKLADLLIDAGRLGEAEQVLAMLKDREVAELVHRGGADTTHAQAALLGPEHELADEYSRLVDAGVARARELDALERRARYEPLSQTDEARRRQLQEEASDWREHFRKWLASLQGGLVAHAAAAHDEAPGPEEVARESTALQTIVRADPDAVGLYYVVTEDRLSVIIATPRGSFGRQVDVDEKDLNRRIEALRQALADPYVDPRPAAAQLYHVLVEPIAPDLERAQPRTLVLSLTDNLRYVPFAALYDGRQYLVERYAIGQIVAGANQRTESRHDAWQIAAFGATRAAAPLPALPGVREELQSIVKTGEASPGVVTGTISLDDQFDREHLEAALRGRHRVVHIGSHFVLHPGSEESSFLLLGDGSHLSLDEIATMDFSDVDQLTLSACDTAKGGGVDDSGAEVEGLATIVARQGAVSVLASLWPVNDRSTASLMHNFYAGRVVGSGLTRAQALRDAQLALLHGAPVAQGAMSPTAPAGLDLAAADLQIRGGAAQAKPAPARDAATKPAATAYVADPARPYAHPYYWAPFVLMGNWL